MPIAPKPAIDAARLLARLDAFAEIGATADGGVDRQAFGEADRRARRALADIALSRGFEVCQDRIANLFIRSKGSPAGRPALMIGSHLDTQPSGGRYDGALGTLAAFEVLEALDDAGRTFDAPVEVVAWSNEEGCRFAPGSMGSQVFAGAIALEDIFDPAAPEGTRLQEAVAETIAALADVPQRRPAPLPAAYLELHIEQGPILEQEEVPIGVVTGVQGTRWLEVIMTGEAAHAGTTPLAARQDPMAAASAALARLYGSVMPGDAGARLTVGRIAAEPGSINAIPASVRFSIDIRHPDRARLDAIEAEIVAALADAAGACGCTHRVTRLFDMPPAQFAEPLLRGIEAAAGRLGVRHRRIVSGAFHDALFVGRVAPAAMVFVPCRSGISHNPKEFVEPQHAVLGAQVLLEAVLDAARANQVAGTTVPA